MGGEGRIIAVEEIIALDEGTRRVRGMSRARRMECSWKCVERGTCCKPLRWASLSVRPCLKRRAATSNSN